LAQRDTDTTKRSLAHPLTSGLLPDPGPAPATAAIGTGTGTGPPTVLADPAVAVDCCPACHPEHILTATGARLVPHEPA